MFSRSSCLVMLVVLLGGCWRGESQTSGESSTLYTLHLSGDLMQIPVLVMDRSRKSRLGLKTNDFLIQLDSGPAFHPQDTHVEGDDPLSMVFLIDAGKGNQKEFLLDLQEQLASFDANLFRPHDRFSVVAFDCKLVASPQHQTAGDTPLVRVVSETLSNPELHSPRHQRCAQSLSLWDAVNGAVSLSGSTPGRRVMFVISSGDDKHSTHTWEDVGHSAASRSFTLFGMRDVNGFLGTPEDAFNLLCTGTGGLVVYSEPPTINQSLSQLLSLIRARYIVEFPRPGNATRGIHHVDITLPNRKLIVLPGGDSAPLPESSALSDPTLTPDAKPRPVLGTRKPLDPH